MRISDWSSDVCSSDLRDHLRAEKILQDRLFANPKIKVLWNKKVDRFVAGEGVSGLVGVDLIDTVTGEAGFEPTDGGFVAIGHSPSTELFKGDRKSDV